MKLCTFRMRGFCEINEIFLDSSFERKTIVNSPDHFFNIVYNWIYLLYYYIRLNMYVCTDKYKN